MTQVKTSMPRPEVRPFRIDVPEEELVELRRRIAATQWPEKETVTDRRRAYRLRRCRISRATGRRTTTGARRGEAERATAVHHRDRWAGHSLHPRPLEAPDALPLIVNHGWPGSIIEQLKIIDPLTNPTAYGGEASDAFHVVIPSMPGYGFSGKPTTTGWGPERMARAWAELMKRLGYTRYVAQGGDGVRSSSTRWACRRLRGCSPSTPTCLPPFPPTSTRLPGPVIRRHPASQPRNDAPTSNSSEPSSKWTIRSMAARPQTLYGIADSPVGLAAWLLDHNDADGQPRRRSPRP